MSFVDAPVRPAAQGTWSFTEDHAATYTAGAEHVPRALARLLELSSVLAVDIENFGLGAQATRLKCVTIATETHAVVADPREPAQARAIADTLAKASALVLHNAMFDVPLLHRAGLLRIVDCAKVTDTLLYARLAEPDEKVAKSLEKASERYLGTRSGPDRVAEVAALFGWSKSQAFAELDLHHALYLQQAALDGLITARLLPVVRTAAWQRITDAPFANALAGPEARSLVEREQRILRMLLRRACRGLRVDPDYAAAYETEVAAERGRIEQALSAAGIRPGNGADLLSWLDGSGMLPPDHPRTPKTGAPQATKKALARLSHPMAADFIAHKELVKISEDYLGKVRDLTSPAGRVHPTTSLLAATTGRSSMSDPPLQQLPDRARGIILADEGDSLTSLDWKAIEPAIAANLSGEQSMLERYESDGDGDLYAPIVESAGVERKTAKTVLLGLLYGEGARGLASGLGIATEAAASLRESVLAAMPAIGALTEKVKATARRRGCMFSVSGRIMPIPNGAGFNPDDPPSPLAYRGINYLCQGSAYDVLADSLIRIEDAGLGDGLYFTVHDEVVCSTEAADEIAALMSTPSERLCQQAGRRPVLRVDRADLGARWSKA